MKIKCPTDERLLRDIYDFARKLKEQGHQFSLEVRAADGGSVYKMYTDTHGEIRIDSKEYSFMGDVGEEPDDLRTKETRIDDASDIVDD